MSTNTLTAGIEKTLRKIIELLVQRDYAALERLTGGERLTASEIESGVDDYGRTLILPPSNSYSRADIIPIRNKTRQEYSIRFRLYTAEEGESDLELQATFIANNEGEMMTVEIDDIIVA
jgi:hypothetical protein